MTRKLFNVRTSVVQMVWADDPKEALREARRNLDVKGFTPYPTIDDTAFVSEPIPEKGWNG